MCEIDPTCSWHFWTTKSARCQERCQRNECFCWIYWFPTKLCHCSSFRGGRPRIFETDLKNPPFWGYFNTKMPRCQSLSTLRRCASCRLQHSSKSPVDGGGILYNRLSLCSNFPIIYKAFMIGYITAGDLPDWSAININDLSICSCEPNGTFDRFLFFNLLWGTLCFLSFGKWMLGSSISSFQNISTQESDANVYIPSFERSSRRDSCAFGRRWRKCRRHRTWRAQRIDS